MTTNADNILERAGLSLRINVSPAYYDGLHLTGQSTAEGVQVRVSKSVLGWIPRSMVASFVARFLCHDEPLPCHRCGRLPKLGYSERPGYMLTCDNCYDGAPDSTLTDMGEGPSIRAALEEWNEIQADYDELCVTCNEQRRACRCAFDWENNGDGSAPWSVR